MLWVTRRGCHVDRTACVWLRGGPVLAEISEIVHDADLLDDKYGRPESYALTPSSAGRSSSSPTTRL